MATETALKTFILGLGAKRILGYQVEHHGFYQHLVQDLIMQMHLIIKFLVAF